MFLFFDKDGSGGVDKYEIMAALNATAENRRIEEATMRGEGADGEQQMKINEVLFLCLL